MVDSVAPFPLLPAPERESLRTTDDVAVILRLHRFGCGAKRIAREVGCAKNTVKRCLAQGAWAPVQLLVRPGRLEASRTG